MDNENKEQKMYVLHYDDDDHIHPRLRQEWLEKMRDTLKDSPENYHFLVLPKSIDVIKL